MEKIGIICEYNPFHNGHVHHLKEIKKLYPDSLIVLVMSGYFTERGDVSLISKYNKTRIALFYGVDIVLELPILYTINSADYFSNEAVRLLNELGVEKLIFGSETDDIQLLKEAALKQSDELFYKNVKKELASGINYPTALSKVLENKFDSNDILAISYIKTIIQKGYNIEPITIKRTNDFNDIESNNEIVSAENIRYKLENNQNIGKYVPNYNLSYINKIDYDKLFELLKYRIITTDNLSIYLGVDEGIDNKIKKEIDNCSSLPELINKVKSKRYTYVRIKRMFMHILLGIKKDDMQKENRYTRILGFNKKGQNYLKIIKNDNLVYKYNDRTREIELSASKIYHMLTNDETTKEEYVNKPIVWE